MEVNSIKVPNLSLILNNRVVSKIIVVTSNPATAITAMNMGIFSVPVAPYNSNNIVDYDLSLVENYIL
jgi:hypothetical protein